MKRLSVRLTLAFVLVTLLAVGTVAVLADWSAGRAFANYVTRQNEFVDSGRVDELIAFYQRAGSWAGVDEFIAQMESGGGGGGGRNRPALLLADGAGQVVYDERGQRAGTALTTEERARAIKLTISSGPFGFVVFSASNTLTPSQQSFLQQLRISFVIAAVAAGALGIVLGLVFSRALSAPLAQLAAAARALAQRQWATRAPVRGADEIADVGRAFNAMADSLQQAETLRRHLMADIAHELRTPLTVMQGNLRALLDDVYPLEKKEIATLYDESRLLNRLVDDLRELALAEAGPPSLNLRPVNLRALAEQARAHFAGAAAAQNVALTLDAPDNLPSARADADRVAQVLRNLIANALRHTPEGGVISIQCSVISKSMMTDSLTTGLLMTVSDSGEGISPEALPHVFERFYRADPSRARASGGSGLGLAIAKAWVEAMGGQMGARSEPERGSAFWFSLLMAQ